MRFGIEARATRLNLLRSRKRLGRVREGEDLLRRKREALVRELLQHAGAAVDDRERISRAASAAYPALVEALAAEGRATLVASGEPAVELPITMRTTQVWGLSVGSVEQAPRVERTLEARGTHPGPTAAATIEASEAFETLVQLLLEAAPRDVLLRTLGRSVAQASRQVRALERRVEPALASAVTRMTSLLDEREREEHVRLRRFVARGRGR
jgi:V/A-type H+-transporting ATPase subunit D